MARVSVKDARVQALLQTGVVPAFAVAGSANGATKLLNEALAWDGETNAIHPNRIHALLSGDIARGINEASLALIERAAAALFRDSEEQLRIQAAAYLDDLRTRAVPLLAVSGADLTAVAGRLDIPPAVLEVAVDRRGSDHGAPHDVAPSLAVRVTDPSRADVARRKPDWSYQDVAVARVLDALRRRPNGRIGLVLPTGAGKTRTALRIVLEVLHRAASSDGLVLWVTHRRTLRSQALRELRGLVQSASGLLPSGAELLTARVRFIMVGELERILSDPEAAKRLALIVVDEAHHAAAPSYQPVFQERVGALSARTAPAPVLLITATPNRMDGLPFRVDEVAFTITYRELAERGTLIIPEFIDFYVDDFDWSEQQLERLIVQLIEETATRFTKTLILAPRVSRVEAFYAAFIARLEREPDHPLGLEDIGFIHGGGNSLGIDNDDFLALFRDKGRAVMVSAQLLLEGFDDPSINAVIITYPTDSVIRLMQAAGRCVRYAPDKTEAFVVQSRNDALAYYFDQRWLVQEISDYLRPDLFDIDYSSSFDLKSSIERLLGSHNVDMRSRARVLAQLAEVEPGDNCRLLLYGYPYFGARDDFAAEATWGAFLETAGNTKIFRALFNRFCELGADLSDPTDFLEREGRSFGLIRNSASGSLWHQLVDVLTAAYFAHDEVHGSGFSSVANGHRPIRQLGPTTWLKYATFTFRPNLPPELAAFLRDCHNRLHVEVQYLEQRETWGLAVKLPLPLGGHEGLLLEPEPAAELRRMVADARTALSRVAPEEQFACLAGLLSAATCRALSPRLVLRLEALLTEPQQAARLLELAGPPPDHQPPTQ